MFEFIAQNPIAVLAAPFGVYILARVIFLAYFHAKRDFVRRYYREFDPKESGSKREPRS